MEALLLLAALLILIRVLVVYVILPIRLWRKQDKERRLNLEAEGQEKELREWLFHPDERWE